MSENRWEQSTLVAVQYRPLFKMVATTELCSERFHSVIYKCVVKARGKAGGDLACWLAGLLACCQSTNIVEIMSLELKH